MSLNNHPLSASIAPPTMNTKTISFRCPEELIQEMDILSKHNQIDRSGFIVQALQSLLTGLAKKGACKLDKAPLPASPLAEEK